MTLEHKTKEESDKIYNKWFHENEKTLLDITNKLLNLMIEEVDKQDWDDGFKIISQGIILRGLLAEFERVYHFSDVVSDYESRNIYG